MSTDVPFNITAWQVILMIILLAILIGVIVQIVLSMTNNNSNVAIDGESGSNPKKKEKTLTSWIEKKDLLYWLLLIVLGSISLFTYQYKGATEVISHWGFAGTIVSIILAIVAIGFTLFQTLSSNLSSEKIAVSADKIEYATSNLDSETLSKSSEIMIEAAEYLKGKMTFIEEKLNLINEDQKTINQLAATGFGPKEGNVIGESSTDIINFDTFFTEVFTEIPYYPQFFTVTLLSLVKEGVDLKTYISNILVSQFTDYEIQNNNNKTQTDDSLRGANMASLGATQSFLINLGIVEKFKELGEPTQSGYLQKWKEELEDDHIVFIDKFVKSLS